MAFRPKSTLNFNQNRRMTSTSNIDGVKTSVTNSLNGNQDYRATPLSTSYLNFGSQNASGIQSLPPTIPPPLPPRADVSRYNRGYSSYNSLYSPYSRFSPGMYSPGAYGGYRTPYNRYGMPPDSYNSFIQLAEESTRPAFESIESIVDIVGSISMMLESTYHAVYSSYNAILGVVDQFSRLKDHLAEVLSFLALLRGLRYLCLKILYLLRLKKDNPSVEAAWKTAKSVSENSGLSQFHSDRKSTLPFFMFVGLVIGAPWLMFKLLANVAKKPFDKSTWKESRGYLTCTANCDFNATRRGEVSFSAGESLYIAPSHLQKNLPHWILVCNKHNKVGLVPYNYLKLQKTPNGTLRLSTHWIGDSIDSTSAPEGMEVITEGSNELPKNSPVDLFSTGDPVVSETSTLPFVDEEL